ncbi:hypothetical protein CP993_25685, partial [Escherichia coli]
GNVGKSASLKQSAANRNTTCFAEAGAQVVVITSVERLVQHPLCSKACCFNIAFGKCRKERLPEAIGGQQEHDLLR